MSEQNFRIGIGYDIHRLVEGRALIVGGVKIPYEKGLLGHSDADVLVHAIIDALLGAMAMEDIGTLFPDTDDRFKDADSLLFVPGNIVGNRQFVDIFQSEHLFQLQSDNNQRVTVVTLSCVKYAGNATDIAQLQFVVAVFGTTGSQNHGVIRQ